MTEPRFLNIITNPFGLSNVGFYAKPTFADIDGDGDKDAFVGNDQGNTLFYRNTGTASNPKFAAPSTNPFGLTDVGYFATPTFADIDGDGDKDAFVGNSQGNTLFYRNTGTASNPKFAAPSTNPFGLTDVGFSAAPTFADIDGDGDLDAFVGNEGGNTLFYRNTGTATNPKFAAPSSNPFGLTDVGFYAAPTFADIDGDGDLDAFVGNRDGNTLFYRNTGTASNPKFAAASSNPFGLNNVGLFAAPTFADINGDGDLDAFVGNSQGNTLFFENVPNTPPIAVNDAFSTNENTTLNGNVRSNDSDPDNNTLTVTQVNGNAANVGTQINLGNGKLTVNGNGSFTFDPTNGTAALTDGYDYLPQGATASTSFNYTISDGNGGTASATATITITGVNDAATIAGTATAAVTEDASTPNLTATGALTVADVDAGQNTFNTTVTSASGNLGSLTITSAGSWNYTVANSAVQFLGAGVTKTETFTVKSVDGTAKDIVITITGVNDTASITGIATGAFTEDTSTPNLTATGALTVNDVDAGENKFNTNVTGTNNLGSLSITDTGSWNYTVANSAVEFLGAGATKTETFTVQSVDGTASLDIVVTITGVNDEENAIATFNAQTGSNNPFNNINFGSYSAPTLADIDGDGDNDLIVGVDDGTLKYYKNTGTATNPVYTAQTVTANPFNGIDVGSYSAPTLADIDGDGDVDAIVGVNDGTLKYYKNTGTATNPVYTAQTVTANPFNSIDVGSLSKLIFANVDGDGDLDLIVGERNGTLKYYKNTGTAINPVYRAISGTANLFSGIDVGYSSAPTFADIDGDGDVDAIVGERNGTLKYYKNDTPPKPFIFVATTGTANPFNGINVGNYSAPTFADIDGDGDVDAIVGVNDGTLKYYKNTGTATNPIYTQQIGTANPFNSINVQDSSTPTLADIDGDGDLDL
ncbi:VCBS domain-containing protein, partial [Nostoc sp. 2RC]|uniref:VCBS domain-containing protein n=1 Tax=Nostoc sp. 2RC TaxID=2485484 RepID=UPI001627A6B8